MPSTVQMVPSKKMSVTCSPRAKTAPIVAKRGDMAAMGREAHQLKGAAANLSAKAVAAAVLKIEEINKSGNSESFDQAMAELEIAAQSFKQYVKQIDWTAVNDG